MSEQALAAEMKSLLASALGPTYVVLTGKKLLYKIDASALESIDGSQGRYAFQTDVLIESKEQSTPLVVIELKSGSFTTHDVITYSAKATRHKEIFPFLRYGFIVDGIDGLGRRFLTHNQNFDFAMAVPTLESKQVEVVAMIKRQLQSAERLSSLSLPRRIKITRFEETVEIGS